ncbi:hypothetical protein F0562_026054 [Nyssa sinensis]|uniref:PWWP domain-containing protein n=1 Tax=Nyssa sinensis TaxID=561372 RepID=A0A5J5BBW8_9ASTE|nr:hypothetical protein F0562_026054 [Nyssa sinensis]
MLAQYLRGYVRISNKILLAMKERDDVVSVASVSESNVTVGGPTVDETLIEPLGCEGRIEGSCSEGQVEEDGGEIMVEVVGSDVFVDGVRGHGVGGDLSGESTGEGLGKEREMTSFDGEGGVMGDLASREVDGVDSQAWDDRTGIGVESFQEIAGSSAEQNRVVVVEEAAVIVNEEALERGKELAGGGSDVSGVLTSDKASVLDDEAQHYNVETGMGGSSVNAGSSCEHTEVVVAEKADMVVSDEGLERGLVEEGVERVMESVNGVGAALDDLTSQRVRVLDDEVRNPGIESTILCSSPMTETSSIQTQVVVRANENLNRKDEVPCTDVEDVNLPCSEIDQISAIETNKDGACLTNNEFLDQHAEVAVGGELGVVSKEEILHSKAEVLETDVLDGKLNCSVEDQQTKVETASESTESHHDLCSDSISFPEPTKTVGGGEVSAGDDKYTSNLNVKAPNNLGLGGVDRDFGEVGIVCADSGSSVEQTQVAAGYSGAIDGKVSISNAEAQVTGEGEVLTTENRVLGAFVENLDYAEDQKLEVKTVGGDSSSDIAVCKDFQSSSERTQVVNGYEVTAVDSGVSNPEVEVPTNDDMDGVGCSEGEQNMMGETSGSAGKDSVICADSKSSSEQACVVERGEFAVVNIEAAFDFKDEVPGTNVSDGSFSGKDQHLKVENVDGGSVNNVGHGDLESSGELIQIPPGGGIETINDDEVPKLEGEAKKEDGETVFATSDRNLCLPEADQNLKDITVLGCAEKEGFVQADPGTSLEHIQIVKGENTAVVEGEKASNFKIEVLEGVAYCFQNDENLDTLTDGGSTERDVVAQANAESYGEQIDIGMQVESSAIDCQGNVEVPEICALDGNISLLERDEEVKVETVCRSTEGVGAVGKDPSVGVDYPPVGDCGTTSLQTSSNSLEVNKSLQDGKQEAVAQLATTLTHEVDGDQSINPLIVDEISDQGASGMEVYDAVEVSAKSQAALSCASFHNGGDTVSSCVSDFVRSLQDANQKLEVHLVGNDLSLPDGDQTMATCVSDVVTSKEVVNEAIETKDKSHEVDKNRIMCAHVSEAKDPSSNSLEVNMSLQDEKQEAVAQLATTLTREVDEDQNINPLVGDEISDQGASGMEVSEAVEVSAKSQAALGCASLHNEGDIVSSCVSDSVSSLQDANQNLEIHLVSNDFSLPDGDQIMATCVSDVVTSKEVVNEAIEAKDESHEVDKNHIMCAHVSEAKDPKSNDKSIVGSLVVDLDTCLNNDERWKLQGVAVKENISLSDKSYCIGDDIQGTVGNVGLHLLESLDGSATGDLCWDGSNVGQEVEVEEQYTDSVQVDLHTGQGIEIGKEATDTEQPEADDENISQQATLKPGSFVRVHQASYLLPSENEGEFSVSDLVWGKVRSHPWWPGQIFDPADASEKAMKYHKKDCFLVAYFGDRTFAWNEASLLKPFRIHFSQIEKQSSSEAFHTAVSCALEEVYRRVELGLACSCIPKDAYEKIESQIVENTGIRQESSRRYGVENSTGVSSFEPDKLVEYIRALAQSPSDGADRLELVVAKAQLLAFSRLKGYYQLPEFQICGGLMENDADTSQLSEVMEQGTPVARDNEQILSGKGKSKIENSSSHKRKHNLKDSEYPRKKERSLTELMGDMEYSPDAEDGSDGKATIKSVSSSSGKKRKAVDSVTDGSLVQDKRISIYAAKVSTTASPFPKPSFKVGECIRRVASQLTGSPSILKCSGTDKAVGFENSQKGRIIFPTEYSSLDDVLSQLHLAARDPMKGYSFFNTIISFFSGFRNSIVLGQYSGRQNSSGGKVGGGRKKNASQAIIGAPEEFEFDDVNDSYWTDMIIQNNSEEEPSGNNGNREGEYQLVSFEPDETPKPSRRSYSRKRFSNGNCEMAVEVPIGYIDERNPELFPGELILNFSEGDSVPSEMNLNKMFRHFGPLKESETEVDSETSRARVELLWFRSFS